MSTTCNSYVFCTVLLLCLLHAMSRTIAFLHLLALLLTLWYVVCFFFLMKSLFSCQVVFAAPNQDVARAKLLSCLFLTSFYPLHPSPFHSTCCLRLKVSFHLMPPKSKTGKKVNVQMRGAIKASLLSNDDVQQVIEEDEAPSRAQHCPASSHCPTGSLPRICPPSPTYPKGSWMYKGGFCLRQSGTSKPTRNHSTFGKSIARVCILLCQVHGVAGIKPRQPIWSTGCLKISSTIW